MSQMLAISKNKEEDKPLALGVFIDAQKYLQANVLQANVAHWHKYGVTKFPIHQAEE